MSTRPRSLLLTVRQAKGMSISELADALGIHVEKVVEIELGTMVPSPQTSRRLEELFGIPLGDLLLPPPPKHLRSLWELEPTAY